MRIPDPQLDYHADRYLAQRVSAHGVSFEQYLTDPAHYDALALEPEPLLPAQRAVGEGWAQEAASVLRNPADGCPHCDDGRIVVCIDDICRGSGHCRHGDGEILCPHCCDD